MFNIIFNGIFIISVNDYKSVCNFFNYENAYRHPYICVAIP